MRIAIDGMLLGRRRSGVEGSIANLAHALAASGRHDYTLFLGRAGLPDPPHPTDGGSGGPALPGKAPIVSTRWPVRFRAIRILWEQLVLPVLLKRGRFDLVHAPGYIAPLRAPVPTVITLYDLIALTHPEFCTVANRFHYRILLPPSVRKAARIIVPSRTTQADLVRLFPAAAPKVRVIPLGIGPEFQPVRQDDTFARIRHTYQLPESFILFVGGLEPKKNLPRLIEAYHLLRRDPFVAQRLVIAGVPSWDRTNVRKAIRSRHMEGDVILTGFVAPGDLPGLYSMADLFVFPSLYEGFGLPPLEAMACGTPVVVSNRGALPEIAGRAALITDALSPDKMAGAMKSLLTTRTLRDELAAKGLALAREFTWAATAAATEAVYKDLGKPAP